MSRYVRLSILLTMTVLQAFVYGCSHPLEIVGNGDIVAVGTGGSGCSYEEAPCANFIVNNYNTNYTAVPRANYGFLEWYGCPIPQGNRCSFTVAASTVKKFWGKTTIPLRATFSPRVPLGNLSGDFGISADCQGTVSPIGGEVVFQFRESTSIAGEQQRQCVGNAILFDFETNSNYLVWLDILHINTDNEPVYDLVEGQLPIREIYASYENPFIVGKTYTLNGITLGLTPANISIQITWLDIDANFNELAQCIVLESQSPIGTPTRRKTYCPRFDGGYEIKENVLAPMQAVGG
jgi:hypothetical protein